MHSSTHRIAPRDAPDAAASAHARAIASTPSGGAAPPRDDAPTIDARAPSTHRPTHMFRRALVRRARNACALALAACALLALVDAASMPTTGAVSAGARRARAGAIVAAVALAATAAATRALDRNAASGAADGRRARTLGPGSGRARGDRGEARAWNGSAWVERDDAPATATTRWMGRDASGARGVDVVQGTGSFGYGGYQDGVGYEDARARAEAERAEQEKWARWEAEDEERESRRAEKKAEKRAEDRAKKEKSRARRWQKYDEAWARLDADSGASSEPLRYADVPWPPKMKELLDREAGGASATDRERKLAYHRCVKRWHPDKFLAKFRARVEAAGDAERARVVERVEAVAKSLTIAYGASSS